MRFTLLGIIVPTIKLKVYTFLGLMNSATKEHLIGILENLSKVSSSSVQVPIFVSSVHRSVLVPQMAYGTTLNFVAYIFSRC